MRRGRRRLRGGLDRPTDRRPGSGSSLGEGSTGHASAVDGGPSVVKTASVEVDVVTDELSSAAQAVVDMATSSKVGGFLVSSVLDLDEGFGSGNVVVRVPAPTFEEVVGDLETICDITRQELEGQDLTAEFLDTCTPGCGKPAPGWRCCWIASDETKTPQPGSGY